MSDVVKNQQKGGRTCIGQERELYIFLWYISNTNTFREIGNLFGVCKSGAWNSVIKVSDWLISIGHNYIKWPSADEVPNIMALWEEKRKIPNIIGAIDCSHIKIKAPMKNKECYFNRKHYYSVHLQAVVDINKKFVDIFIGEPGSLHDSRVLRKSELYQEAHSDKDHTFSYNSLLLGDSAYPLLDWLIPPFKDNGHLSQDSTQFNKLHSSARIVVENAFGILKSRFRRLLHFTEQTNLKLIVNLIASACILHNICLNENDDLEDLEPVAVINETFSNELEQEQPVSQSNRRQQIVDYLIRKNIIVQAPN